MEIIEILGNIKPGRKSYLQYILKMWHAGDRDQHWVMKQLERAFKTQGSSRENRQINDDEIFGSIQLRRGLFFWETHYLNYH
jgi:hypothetical protein